MIIIIDYKTGNIGSILNMMKKVGAEVKPSFDRNEILKADKLILPGVGSFDTGMQNLYKLNLIDIIKEKTINEETPILGICLGMQLLTTKSDEGTLQGLGLIPAETIKFYFLNSDNKLKIPHMGWNTVDIRKEDSLYADMYTEPRFYFVHSYHVVCHDQDDILTTTNYGFDFVSSFRRGNIMGTQFHPEKSHKFGLRLLKNFVELV